MDKELLAAHVLTEVIANGQSIRTAMKIIANRYYFDEKNTEKRSSVHALVFETIRRLNLINRLLSDVSNFPSFKLVRKRDSETAETILNVMRIAIYRMKFEQHPAPLVTNTIVEVIRKLGYGELALALNTFCLNLEAIDLGAYLVTVKDPMEHEALTYYHPYWYIAHLKTQLAAADVIRVLDANNKQPSAYIRINYLQIGVNFCEELKDEGLIVIPDPEYSDIYRVTTTIKPLPHYQSYKDGKFFIQSRSSAIIPHLLAPQADDLILDACSAPGAKTTQLASLSRNSSKILAVESNPKRMKELQSNLSKYHTSNVETFLGDVRNLASKYINYFDKVLLDVPCTGSGTFGSRPEIKWRLSKRKALECSHLQRSLLVAVAKYVKFGGLLIYSTCSVLPIENEDVITHFLTYNKEFSLEPLQMDGYSSVLEHGRRIFSYMGDSEGFTVFALRKRPI